MTEYLIFKKSEANADGSPGGWHQMGRVEARSTQAALREDLAASVTEGEYVAVPARSWKPVTVKVETKTALKFS